MHGYWEALQGLVKGGEPFVSVTLVDVLASAPANVGSKMLVTRAGLHHGTVGGGKIEAKALAEAVAMLEGHHPAATPSASTHFTEWNLQRDVGMTCGGVVRLFFERYNVATWPIVVFGAGHCAQALVRLLLTLHCHVTAIDAREEWLSKFPDPASTAGKLKVVKADRPLRDFVRDLSPNAFVVLMTMGHASDQPILEEILRTRGGISDSSGGGTSNAQPSGNFLPPFPYVGVIGSEAKAAALKRGLMGLGIPEPDATPAAGPDGRGRYLCPIGLPLGTNDPAEIAISIAAQLLQVRDRFTPART